MEYNIIFPRIFNDIPFIGSRVFHLLANSEYNIVFFSSLRVFPTQVYMCIDIYLFSLVIGHQPLDCAYGLLRSGNMNIMTSPLTLTTAMQIAAAYGGDEL